MSNNKIFIDGSSLTIEDVVNVARNNYYVELDPSAIPDIEASNRVILEAVKNKQVIYGITTGFGSLSKITIEPEDASRLSRNIVVSHAVGVGEELPREFVRAGMLVRISALSKGHSGVQLQSILTLIDMLNKDVTPIIPSQGSLACSGDLCLLSHVARIIAEPIDEDDDADNLVRYNGQILKGRDALKLAGIPTVKLGPKEGLALTNGSTFTAGILCLLWYDIFRLAQVGCGAVALTMEALTAVSTAFDDRIHQSRGQGGQIQVARYIRKLIEGSELIDSTGRIQDAYSLRCVPQIQGPLFDALENSKKVLLAEINAATDNPLIFDNAVLSGGNFHGEPLGVMSDYLKIALTELGSVSHSRITRLVSKDLSNGLPSMLTPSPGLNSGYMISQYTSAALFLDCQHEAVSDVVNSTPTCENQEDHNSNSMNSVLHLTKIVSNVKKILSIELLCAVRGIEIRFKELGNKKLSEWSTKTFNRFSSRLVQNVKDHSIDNEISMIENDIYNLITEDDLEDKFKPNQRNVGVPRGFRDFDPHEMRIRKILFQKIESVFKKYCAPEIETPILELKSVLFGQYGDQGKLVFDLEDQGGSMCSLRYDLTVPLARYVAQNGLTHFKRYQIGRVFRRDAPNIAKGRYRSFFQCDFDIAGNYDLMVPDAEILSIFSDILSQFDIEFTIKFNHKRLLDLILGLCNVPEDKYMTVCSSIDKLDKEPWEAVAQELKEKSLNNESIELIKEHLLVSGEPYVILGLLRTKYFDNLKIQGVLDEIELLFTYLKAYGALNNITFELTLCRGLSYYTGIIFEAVLLKNEIGVGSIGGGGRYDGLIGTFGKTQVPAVGCSIGVERLYTIMMARNSFEQKEDTQIYVTWIGNNETRLKSIEVASLLRKNNFLVEIPYKTSKITPQIESVAKRIIPMMILVGESELKENKVIVKDMINKIQTTINIENLCDYCKSFFK